MAICTGVSNLHFQKLLLEVFEQKNWKKKLLIAAKEKSWIVSFTIQQIFVLFATKMFVIQSHFTTTNYWETKKEVLCCKLKKIYLQELQ